MNNIFFLFSRLFRHVRSEQRTVVLRLLARALQSTEIESNPTLFVHAVRIERGLHRRHSSIQAASIEILSGLLHTFDLLRLVIEFRFRAQLRVDEGAVRERYEREMGGSPAAPPFEAVQADLHERLLRQALDERVESWVRELREGAEIRRNP